MALLDRLLGGRARLRQAQALLAAGDAIAGLSLLQEQASGPVQEALRAAQGLVIAGDLAGAAERLYPLAGGGKGDPALEMALQALGDRAFKTGWREAGPWLPSSLHHFTELSNLPEILAAGELLSRFQLELRGIEPPKPGGDARSWGRDRQQGLLDFVHLAMTAPHPMLFAAAKRVPRPVYLVFHPAPVLRKETRFSDRNATDAGARLYDGLEDLRGIARLALSGLHPAENKRAVQAEVLVCRGIRLDPHLLRGILFRSRYEMESALASCKPEGWLRERFRVDPDVFA